MWMVVGFGFMKNIGISFSYQTIYFVYFLPSPINIFLLNTLRLSFDYQTEIFTDYIARVRFKMISDEW